MYYLSSGSGSGTPTASRVPEAALFNIRPGSGCSRRAGRGGARDAHQLECPHSRRVYPALCYCVDVSSSYTFIRGSADLAPPPLQHLNCPTSTAPPPLQHLHCPTSSWPHLHCFTSTKILAESLKFLLEQLGIYLGAGASVLLRTCGPFKLCIVLGTICSKLSPSLVESRTIRPHATQITCLSQSFYNAGHKFFIHFRSATR